MKVIEYKKDGKFYRIPAGYSSGSSSIVSVPVVEVGGTNWKQAELAAPIEESYLNEYGWKCCEDDGEDAKELYRWIYRCIFESLTVPMRTIEINGESISLETDGKKFGISEIEADIITKRNYINSNGVLVPQGERIVKRIRNDRTLSYLRIPVFQFGITDEKKLYTVTRRVMLDTPLLMFPFYPCTPDKISAVKDESGIYQYIYSCVPIESKRCEAVEIINEHIAKISAKIEELYRIKVGDQLTVNQMAKVCKVIHDYLIMNSNVVGGFSGETNPWALQTMYAVFDHRLQGNCESYTVAFCAIARMYGIEAVEMTGEAYVDTDGMKEGYELYGSHAWVLVRLSDEVYGTYPSDPSKWSCIDVYFDEATLKIVSKSTQGVSWQYFLDMKEINIIDQDIAPSGYSCRMVDMTSSYGELPISGKPLLSMPYSGQNIYDWEV